MSNTPKLDLPEISFSQSQKEITHNEALRMLDFLVEPSVKDKDLSAPPGSPTQGDCYIVGPTATGDWEGEENNIAQYYNSLWYFQTPHEGWRVWIDDEDCFYSWKGTEWSPDEPVVAEQTLTPADNIEIDWSLGNVATCLLDRATTTFTFTGAYAGAKLVIRLKQDTTGGRLVSWPTSVRYGADISEITLSTDASKTDYIGFIYNLADTKYDVVAIARGF